MIELTRDDLVAIRNALGERYPIDERDHAIYRAGLAAGITTLRERIAALEGERYALKDELRQANGVRDVFASAVVAQAMQEVDKMPNPQESPVDKSTGLQGPDPNGVICPQCVTQFRAVPVNVQARIAALRRVVAAADAMRRYDSYRMPGEPHWQYDVARAAIKEQTP